MSTQPLNILLVEDDEVDVANVRRALASKGIRDPLYVAHDGVEALKLLRGRPGRSADVPTERRVLLLDVNMPRMGGVELLREIRSIPSLKAIPVIVLSASNDESDRSAMERLSVSRYLLKPVDADRLEDAIESADGYWQANASL